eukprot:1335534-Rhodomonas_salina.3
MQPPRSEKSPFAPRSRSADVYGGSAAAAEAHVPSADVADKGCGLRAHALSSRSAAAGSPARAVTCSNLLPVKHRVLSRSRSLPHALSLTLTPSHFHGVSCPCFPSSLLFLLSLAHSPSRSGHLTPHAVL